MQAGVVAEPYFASGLNFFGLRHLGWQLVQRAERRRGARYTHCLMLRDDAQFFYPLPLGALATQVDSRTAATDQLCQNRGVNDKVFLLGREAADSLFSGTEQDFIEFVSNWVQHAVAWRTAANQTLSDYAKTKRLPLGRRKQSGWDRLKEARIFYDCPLQTENFYYAHLTSRQVRISFHDFKTTQLRYYACDHSTREPARGHCLCVPEGKFHHCLPWRWLQAVAAMRRDSTERAKNDELLSSQPRPRVCPSEDKPHHAAGRRRWASVRREPQPALGGWSARRRFGRPSSRRA